MLEPTPGPSEIPGEAIRVLLLFGGQSAEHDVSRVSAAHVAAALDPARYEVTPIAIGRDGTWAVADAARELLSGETWTGALPPGAPADGLPTSGTTIDPLPVLRGQDDARDTASTVVALPVLHGPNGEDGTIQGLLELADIPYVGSGVLGSALAMDKAAAKEMAAAHDIAQARFRWAREDEIDTALLSDIIDDLGLPLFVKPANMGSSVGVSRVSEATEIEGAVDAALEHDQTIVFEEAVSGREIEIGVLGLDPYELSVPGEVIPAAEFYDYDDKYRDGAAQLIIPAALDDHERAALERLARTACRALRVEVMARVDVFYEHPGRGFLLNEVNTIPGCTPISMFPALWKASGLDYPALLDAMIGMALRRHRIRASRRR